MNFDRYFTSLDAVSDSIERARKAGTLRQHYRSEAVILSGITHDGEDVAFAQVGGSDELVRLS